MTTLSQLYLRLLHRETDAEGLALARDFLLANIPSPASERGVRGSLSPTTTDWASLPTAEDLQLPDLENTQQLATALRWYATTALLQWDWLRSIGHSAGGHRPANALLFRAYLDAVGLDDPTLALAAQYRALMCEAGISAPTHGHTAILNDEAYTQPCAMLALACLPVELFGIILGYTQAHCQLVATWLDWLQQQLQRHGLPTGYVQRHRYLVEHHNALLPSVTSDDKQAVAEGRALYRDVLQASAAGLNRQLTASPTAQAELMLRGKLPYAVGHHSHVVLQGKSLDQWLEEGDLPRLRQALLRSRYIKAETLNDSPLLKATEFGGPMFGVFSEEEQRQLRLWLVNEECAQPVGADPGHESPEHRGQGPLLQTTPPARELYHHLLNRVAHPHSLTAAARYAEKILTGTRLAAPLQTGLRRRFPYSPAALRQRVDAIHQHEMQRYRPLQGPPKLPRELYLWGIEQMAPAILVDGCWLENAAGAEPAADEVRRRLLQTFADEAGAGRAEWNHPNVYRRLLESLEITLPPVDSFAFVQHQRLTNAAFPLPVYLLAIGAWPERFFPELLGLNLAIELSGLGATYMHAVDALRYHGIDPAIVQLHLSIDNLASGHAALAREAIEIYLDQMKSLGGQDAMTPAWQRIWTGYLSLATASLPFAWAGLKEYGRWKLSKAR